MGKNRRWLLVIIFALVRLAGCVPTSTLPNLPLEQSARPSPSRTPFQPVPFTATPSPTATPPASPTPQIHSLWAAASVPAGLKDEVTLPSGWVWSSQAEQADLLLDATPAGEDAPVQWVYALAAPFPTVTDGVSLDDLQRVWRGESHTAFAGQPLLIGPDTLRAFRAAWGTEGPDVRTIDDEQLVDAAWELKTWALVPFERLEPRLKVLRVDGQSPIEHGNLPGYPLRLGYRLQAGRATAESFGQAGGALPTSNRDPQRMTVVMLTGTTALVRATAWRMENQGMTYPARDILPWLLEPDFTHISNEVSFNPACPAPDPYQKSLQFCSPPETIQLLDAIDADVIELSGNHNNDWGREAFTYSLELYRQRGWSWFAGGANQVEAQTPLWIEHNGNRLAFLGCNAAGPPTAWATTDQPGAAHCDLDALVQQIGDLRAQGYTPIVTLQYYEIYVSFPSEHQAEDFARLANAGAAIVSGSQAHFPQGFAFSADGLIHYGLGNLFFDQMDIPVVGTRREFLDRHVFYDGRLLSTELLTAMLEDYSRPRPMTPEERAAFLADIFAASGW